MRFATDSSDFTVSASARGCAGRPAVGSYRQPLLHEHSKGKNGDASGGGLGGRVFLALGRDICKVFGMGRLQTKFPGKQAPRKRLRWVALERRLPRNCLGGLGLGALFAWALWRGADAGREQPLVYGLFAVATLALFLHEAWRLWRHAKPSHVVRTPPRPPYAGGAATFRYRYRGDAADLARVVVSAGIWRPSGYDFRALDEKTAEVELPPTQRAEGYVKLVVPAPRFFGDRPSVAVEITDRRGRKRTSYYSLPA